MKLARILIAGLVLAGCKPAVPAAGPPPGMRKHKVTAVKVARAAVTHIVEVIGTVEAREEVSVAAGVSGIIEKVNFQEGTAVTPETVLCTIDEKRYALEVTRASAEKARADSDVERAESVYKQRAPLFEKKYITEEELNDLKSSVDRAKAEQSRAQAALEIAQKSENDSKVRPPISGILNSKNISKGEYVEARTVIATIVDVSVLHVRFAVPESESTNVKKDGEVTFVARASDLKPMTAKIFWVSQTADPRIRTVECKAVLVDPPPTLKPGFSGTVKLTLASRTQALVIPAESVIPTERGFIAFVLEGSKVRERKLQLGLETSDNRIEILSGVSEGDTVIVRGGSALRDGGDVEVLP